MKPNFALHFTDDSIALLHRTRRGWVEIGTTPFAVDDLPAALATLREKAEALEPAGITTKLVIPNSQIKYLEIAAPGPDAAKRRAQIAAGLEGQTPYDVSDLVWDHWGKGPTVQVAVLARETLDEAEGFAAANGFNPVSFVAIPDDAAYGGEPWFGPSSLAATILKPGEKVDRDQDPIRLAAAPFPAATGDADPEPAPEPEPEPQAAPEPQAEPEPTATAAAEAQPEPPTPEPPPAAEAAAEAQAEPLPEAAPETQPEPQPEPATAPLAEDPAPAPLRVLQDDLAGLIRPETSLSESPVDPAAIAATLAPSEAPAPSSVLSGTIPDMDEAPMAIDVAEETIDDTRSRRPATSVLIDPSVEDDLPPLPSGAALSAYNRRGSDAAVDLPTSAPAMADRMSPRAAPVAAAAAAPARKEGKAERPAGVRPPPKFSYETPGEKPAAAAPKALRGLGALVTAPSIPGGRKAKVVAPIATAAATAAAATATTAAAATTTAKRPAGLGTRPMPVRGKPRHLGLILTGLLLIMLALAAALSTYYVSWRDQGNEAVTDVAAADPAAAGAADPAAAEEAIPAPEDEMLADLVDPAEIATTPEDEAAADGVVMEAIDPNATLPASTAPETATPETATAAAPEAAPPAEPAPQTTVVAGDPARTAPSSEPQDEIFLAASDSAPRTVDPVALPLPAAQGDPPPAAQLPPPPFGTMYQFDENGLIRATPEGIVTPEGVLLTAGPPPRLPPERPASIAEAAAAAAIDAALAARNAAEPGAAPPATGEDFVIPADPALADNRPLARPANLVPAPQPTETATDDDAALSPELASRLAGVRPAARPDTLAAEAVASGLIAPATASNNGSLALVAPEGAVSPLGLAISRRPAARPEDMNRAVEEAVAAAIRQLDPVPEDDAPYAVEENEPEVAAVAPRIPSSANVAQQATVRNAIDLRDINLIGVYGTSAERYALVRNPNGRYVKVEVGDRLDGGRVAAITASELRYEKRGRMVVLELPNS